MTFCPYCNISYKNLTNHVKLKHPEKYQEFYTGNSPEQIKSASVSVTAQGHTEYARAGGQATPPSARENSTIEDLKNELEIKRLQRQLELLDTPQTNTFDPISKLLEMQQNNFRDALASERRFHELELKFNGLQSGNGEDDLIKTLLPMLPEILPALLQKKTIQGNQPPETETPRSKGEVSNLETKEKGVKKMDTSQVPNEYLQKIRSGEITEAQAYTFTKLAIKTGQVPAGTKMPTKEDFHEEFLKIKNGKE